MTRKLRKLDQDALANGEYIYLDEDEIVTEDSISAREMTVFFAKDYKTFVNVISKKEKTDYLLHINKIIREKFDSHFTVPNRSQAFILNYEIKKLLDKAINIKNQKYHRIICLNSDLSINGILNTCMFLNRSYEYVNFKFIGLRLDITDDQLCTIKKSVQNISFQN